MFGIRKGALAGVIFGMLQFIQEPYFLDAWQFVLEYPLAFGTIGLAGIFKELRVLKKHPTIQFILGGTLVGILRFICHFVAGIIVWGIYAPKNMSAPLYSFVYNVSYVFPDIAISLIAGAFMFASKNIRNMLDNATKKVMPYNAQNAQNAIASDESMKTEN
jgi:thiamine transporter